MSKATDDQILIIKNYIDKYFALLTYAINKFESKIVFDEQKRYTFKPVDKNEWRYFVIEHDYKQAMQDLEIIFSLSALDLTILFEAIYPEISKGPGILYKQLRTLNYLP